MFTMPFILRPFCEQDYETVTAIFNAVYPEHPQNVNECRRDDQQFDETRHIRRRYVAVEPKTEQVVGYGFMRQMDHPQKFWLDLMVHPEWQRRGVGSLLFERLIDDLRSLNAITIQISAREDKMDDFLKNRGFKEANRVWKLWLSVADADLLPFLSIVQQVAAKGIIITTLLEERKHDPDCLLKLCELIRSVNADWGTADLLNFEELRRWLEQYPLPEAYFIAKLDDQYLGLCNLEFRETEPEQLYQDTTCIRSEYRRQGVATALKVHAIEYAKQGGYQTIVTYNDSKSRYMPILALNEKLGFQRQFAWITYINYAVTISDYNPEWPSQYEEEKAKILAVIGNRVVAIEHVGSTAVSGLWAKPIIDIMVAVHHLEDAKEYIEPLKNIGYEYVPEYEVSMPERRYFRKGPLEAQTHHLHMVELRSDFWEKHLLFRDFLRTHPETAQHYCELKRELANKYRFNRDRYTNAKTSFIESVIAQAKVGKAANS